MRFPGRPFRVVANPPYRTASSLLPPVGRPAALKDLIWLPGAAKGGEPVFYRFGRPGELCPRASTRPEPTESAWSLARGALDGHRSGEARPRAAPSRRLSRVTTEVSAWPARPARGRGPGPGGYADQIV